MPRLRGRSAWRSERRKPSKPRNACGSKPSRAPSSRGRKSYFPLKRSSWMRSTRKSLGNWPSSRMERPSCNRSSKRTPPIGGRGRSTATRKTPTRSVPRSGPVSAGRSTASGASSSRAVTGPTGLTCGTRRSSLTSGGTRSERSRRSYGRAGEPSDLVLPRTILATRHAVPPDRERKLSIRDGPRPRQESSPPLPRRLRADAPDGNSPNRAGHRRRRVQGGGARSRVEGLRGRPDRARDEPEPRSSVHPDHWVLGGRTPPDDWMVSGPVRRAEHQDDRPGEDVRRVADRSPRGSRRGREHEGVVPAGPRRTADLGRGLRPARRDHLRPGPRGSRKESVRGRAVERVGGPRDPTVLPEPAVRRAGADRRDPPHAGVRPARGRYRESQDPPPVVGLEGHTPLRPVHAGWPRDSTGRAGRNGADGRQRTHRSASGVHAHGGPLFPSPGPAGARGGSARSVGREAPPPRGGPVRPCPPAVRPADPRLWRPQGAGGPKPADHRAGKGERDGPRRDSGPPGGVGWNSPRWAGTNSSRDSSWRASGRRSASGATPSRRRSRRSSKTRTSGSSSSARTT